MRRRWRQSVLLALAVLLAASWGLSRALDDGWARRSLLRRLAASFGRPVEVGSFGFNLLNGLRLEASSVTVGEDPRFGQEYFFRAQRMMASVRWTALLRGRFEFDTVSLTRPSLNLVRTSDGRWNIESWLPPADAAQTGRHGAAEVSALPRATSAPTVRLSRIEVDNGRINFKRDASKIPLALVGVSGHLVQDAVGRWNIDLEANPMRAPAVLQQAGTLRLRGVVAGVSARLRPAALALSWEEASLADLTRLLRGRDYGVRGTLAAELSATREDGKAGGDWSIQGTLRLRGVHGWALAARAGDPGANVSIQANWRPGQPHLAVSRCIVEGPQSRLSAVGDVDWSHGFRPSLTVVSSNLALADILAWHRAFLPSVANDLTVDGTIGLEAKLSGWPLLVGQAALSSPGAVIRHGALPGPIRIGPVAAQWAHNTLLFRPAAVLLPSVIPSTATRGTVAASSLPASTLKLEASLGPFPSSGDWRASKYRLTVSGAAQRAQDLLAMADAVGWPVTSGWTAEGLVSGRLTWTGAFRPGTASATGTLNARDLRITTALLNQPLVVPSASIELRRGLRRVNVASLQALGAHWTGSLKSSASGPWEFDLSADRLDAAELDRWLGPRARPRPNLLLRMLPFAASAAPSETPARAEAFERIEAQGRLRVGELLLAPLRVQELDATATIERRTIALRNARARFYGGELAGELDAHLAAEPAYSFQGQLRRVDLSELAAAVSPPGHPGRFAGVASGELKLEAHGIGREALATSLEGQGLVRARRVFFGGLELRPAADVAGGHESQVETHFYGATARLQIADRRVHLEQLALVRPDEHLEVTGSVDFARRLDLRVQDLSRPLAAAHSVLGDADEVWVVGGTLEAPRVTPQPLPGSRGGQPVASR
jgi:uncharacterized protein involved in outer membrane biogenesis